MKYKIKVNDKWFAGENSKRTYLGSYAQAPIGVNSGWNPGGMSVYMFSDNEAEAEITPFREIGGFCECLDRRVRGGFLPAIEKMEIIKVESEVRGE